MALPVIPAHESFKLLQAGALIALDIRPAKAFITGFVPGSYALPLGSDAVHEFRQLLPASCSLLLVADADTDIPAAVLWLEKAGIMPVAGLLEDGVNGWQQAGYLPDMVIDIDPDELAMDIPFDDALQVVDVRSTAAFAEGHIKHAHHLPLIALKDAAEIALIPEEANLYLHCYDGTRAVMAAAVLKTHGLHQLRVLVHSWEAISNTRGITVEKDTAAMN